MGIASFFIFIIIFLIICAVIYEANKNEKNKKFEKLVHKQKDLIEKNRAFDKLRQPIINRNAEGESYEKQGDFEMAMTCYEDSTSYIKEKLNELKPHIPVFGFNRLMILYRKHNPDLEIPFIKQSIIMLKGVIHEREIKKWEDRLQKLINKSSPKKKTLFSKFEPSQYTPNQPTLGEQIEAIKRQYPPFDFYEDRPKETGLAFVNIIHKSPENTVSKEYFSLRDKFKKIINEGEHFEARQDIEKAIQCYEIAVGEKYTGTKPYERLMVLYRKIKQKDEERRIIKQAINFFKTYRQSQREYILSIANTPYKKSKAMEYINNNKKIFYYGGAFELYNPYPVIEKWEKRLEKL